MSVRPPNASYATSPDSTVLPVDIAHEVPARPVPAARIEALDVTKGLLVVLMVVYHTLNYSTDYRLPFRYLAFLPPSFILITGFLLSHVYLARYRAIGVELCQRLLSRGLKLLVIFTCLNILGVFFRSQNYHGPAHGLRPLFEDWVGVFLWGGSRLAAFDVLLPIAHLLLLAPILLWLTLKHRIALAALTVALLGACAWLAQHGECPPNLALITAGVIGMLAGLLPSSALPRAARLLPLALLLYALHVFIGSRIGQTFLHQIVSAMLALVILYGLALLARKGSWTTERLLTLGRYSLVGYIGQIAILQLYSHVFGRPDPVSAGIVVMFLVSLILTIASVEGVHWAQHRSKFVQISYRAVMP